MSPPTASVPPAPTSIAWQNVDVQVTQFSYYLFKWKRKTILHNLVGSFALGTLNSLVGPSGSGKTTLLNCFSGSSGGVLFSGQIYLKASTQSYYIRQHVDESIARQLTVGQLLQYAFAFKNSNSPRRHQMEAHIKTVMTELMLPEDLQDRPFGKCSGGEQKRIAIAQELMSLDAPAFLFLDEPTTGLDSASAYQVTRCLYNLAKHQNITVIASIHSPNSETLDLFDKVYVLARGGVAIYSGPPRCISSRLEALIGLRCSSEEPPIEALIKLACVGIDNQKVRILARETYLDENCAIEEQHLELSAGLPRSSHKAFSLSNLTTHLARHFHLTFIAQLNNFLFLPLVLTAFFTTLYTIFHSEMATASGCFSLDNATTSTCAVEDPRVHLDFAWQNDNYLAYVLMTVGLLILLTTVLLYRGHVKAFQLEHQNYWYSTSVFYLSSTTIAFLELNCNVIIATLLSYFISGQHAADNYSINIHRLAVYFLFLWLLCLYYQSIGQLIALTVVNHPTLAILATQLIFASCDQLNGVFVKLHRLENPLLELISQYLGFVDITRGFYYAVFGIDRCNPETEYSRVLLNRGIEREKIGEYVGRVLVNVAVIKIVTVIVLYGKFSVQWSWKRKRKSVKADVDWNSTECVTVELPEKPPKISNSNSKVPPEQSTHQLLLKPAIIWHNLTLYSSIPIISIESSIHHPNRQQILRHLSGQLHFGTLTGLMGCSGAGKTSLLQVLNGQLRARLSSETSIRLSKLMKISTCFITQNISGHLLPGLTGRQAVLYASKLKNHASVDHEAIAQKWLTELGLVDTMDTKVEYCSGGERKRLAVALELTALEMPNLICIDEPTSGLDSNSAEIVISTLKKLCHTHPIAIVTSIHQPTADILRLFDQLYILARSGVCIYSGGPSAIQSRLDQVPALFQSSQHPAFPIETLIKQSCFRPEDDPLTEALVQLQNTVEQPKDDHFHLTFLSSGVHQNRIRFSLHSVYHLSGRFRHYIFGYLWKEWLLFTTISLFFALLLRSIFPTNLVATSGCLSLEENFCQKSEHQITEELKLSDGLIYHFYITNIYLLLVIAYSAVGFFNEFTYFMNEHRNSWYSTGVWYLVRSLFEILPLVVTHLFYVYLVNIYDSVATSALYWPFFYLLTLAAIASAGHAHIFALLGGGSLTRVLLIACPTYFLLLLLSNTHIPFYRMHPFWQLLSYLSVPRFLHEAAILLVYGFGRCKPGEVQIVLYSMAIEDADYWTVVCMLVGNLIVARFVALWLLLRRVNGQK